MSTLATWPSWARVHPDLTAEGGPPVVRADIEGPVAQGAVEGPGWYRRTVTVELGTRMTAFRAWAEAVDAGPFAWRDKSDGVTRQVRIEGGAAGVRYRQVRDQPGPLWWTAELTLEGPARAWAEARSIWSQEIDLGDASHVYVQALGAFKDGDNTPARSRIDLSVRLPDAWVRPQSPLGPPAYLVRVVIRKPPQSNPPFLRLFLDDGITDSPTVSGPELLDTVENSLGLAIRVGGARLMLRGPPPYRVEPYRWTFTTPAERATLATLIAALDALPVGRAAIEIALCWIGAGSVVDFGPGTTTENGTAPVLT